MAKAKPYFAFSKLTQWFTMFLLCCFVLPSKTQTSKDKIRLLLILDCSYSMYSNWGQETRMDIAKKKIIEFVDSLAKLPDIQLGLRCYGHTTLYRPDRNCEDTKLEVPFDAAKSNAALIKKRIQNLEPMGTTPIAYSIGQSASDFPPLDSFNNRILLITDGIEECQGNPCQVSLELQQKKIIAKPYVIGMNVALQDQHQLDCIGRFFNAESPELFLKALYTAFSDMQYATTAQVYLLDDFQKPTETDVLMSFYDPEGIERYQWIHTLSNLGLPDTLILNPRIPYTLKVHTLPPVESKPIILKPGGHTIIPLAVPQGTLQLDLSGKPIWFTPSVIVYPHKKKQLLNVQPFGTQVKYLKGYYDLEILTLPRLYKNNVFIEGQSVRHIEIPASGAIRFIKANPGTYALFVLNGTQSRWIHYLSNTEGEELVFLLPGNYRMVYQALNINQIERSKTLDFTVTSGMNKTLPINQ